MRRFQSVPYFSKLYHLKKFLQHWCLDRRPYWKWEGTLLKGEDNHT